MDADVTDSAGTPGDDETPQAEEADTASETPAVAPSAPPARRKKRHWLRWTAAGVSLVVLAGAGAGWWYYDKLDANIKTDLTAAEELRAYEKERPTPLVVNAQNILLIGSDSRSGSNKKYGRDEGTQRSDTTILLHLSADRQRATAMSIPRDLMVQIPACHKADNTLSEPQFAQFNWAFEFGGTACTIRTVEKLTGIRIDHQMVIDFNGFKDMVDAVDGVEICLTKPINDTEAHLKLPAGRQTLRGEQALGFVRARHSIGNGSDTERMGRQQQFLGALVKKVQSSGVLLNPTRLLPVLDAATKSLTTDPGLDSLKDLYDLTRRVRDIPTDQVQFLTLPRESYAYDANRDQLVEPDAENLFAQLRTDVPIKVSPTPPATDAASGDDSADYSSDDGSSDGEYSEDEYAYDGDWSGDEKPGRRAPRPGPTFHGTSAAVGMCG
ncbi:LCP family protein [Streptomyces sp. NBC_01465]|uniref:LCP family protein n=1 Tax=Streptomyces sp. NBC_01465 TaxID=2903878 RepID=UPI002E342628|nr:LCP family protein [Streptomyces sp. NBC_01465]